MSSTRLVYMDHNATTPLDPRVLEEMRPYLTEHFGNAASTTHVFGRNAHQAVELARAKIGALFNVTPNEVIWTSGATESNNLRKQQSRHQRRCSLVAR
jgi:cysteine desulfurase